MPIPGAFTVHSEQLILLPGWIIAPDSAALYATIEDDAGVDRNLLVAEAPAGISIQDDAGVVRQWVRNGLGEFPIQDDAGATHPLKLH